MNGRPTERLPNTLNISVPIGEGGTPRLQAKQSDRSPGRDEMLADVVGGFKKTSGAHQVEFYSTSSAPNPSTSSRGLFSFIGQVGASILNHVPGVAASTGSACHSGSVELSPVLQAMAVQPDIGMGAIRFSLGRTTTRDEIESVVESL